LKEKHLYTFGDFSLNAEDHALKRGDESVPVTPKMFDLLLVFVQHPGRVLGKDFLLQSVWPDSFVEEGNVTFNIRQLRKALGDDTQSPSYIETVPRRGYRFIAPVQELTLSDESEHPLENAETAESRSGFRRYLAPASAVGAVLLIAGLIGSWFVLGAAEAAPVLSAPFTAEKLSTTGMVYGAAISPDGRTVVYSSRTGTKQSVWLRQLESGSNTPLIPPSDDHYYLFAFAPDGNSIYFTRAKQALGATINVYRISFLGGIPELIASGTEGWIGISPDGERISFVRCPRSSEEWCSLWIADAKDGTNEKKLVSRPGPIRIGDNQISLDGKKIAFAAGQSRNSANDFQLLEVAIDTGVEREVTAERFFNIKSLAWLPDGSGILVTAARQQNKHFRIWQVSTATGAAEPLTKDSEAYDVLSLDSAARYLVATQVKQDFQLNVFYLDDISKKTFLADAATATFAPDGKIYFASAMSGNDEIWSINPDTTEQRQLTNDPAGDARPVVSPDNKTIYFVSNRTGKAQIWKMNADGSNQTRVTEDNGGGPLFVRPDGELLYYKHALTGALWSVALQTGEERLVLDMPRRTFAFSPDGSMVALEDEVNGGPGLTIYSLEDSRPRQSFELPRRLPRLVEFSWLPNGRSLVYLMAAIEYDKNTLFEQALTGGSPRELGSIGNDEVSEVSGLAISPDGKSFCVVQGGWKHDAILFKGLR
jgi:Tol biopolymer transport system component/DNA-binding winged helix-turn-helix (wHTH) protein